MRDDHKVARFTPATPRSRRLGRELRRLRDGAGLTLADAGKKIGSSGARIGRIETGEIKPRAGDVLELLRAYDIPLDGDHAMELTTLARELREPGWWRRLDTLSNRYLTYIAYETEATQLRNWEPVLIPGLLQTEKYARAVASVGRETEAEAIDQRVQARLTRQEVLTRKRSPLRFHAIISEAALMVEVGNRDVLLDQLKRIIEMSARPNITVQVLRFAAGAHLADRGGFAVLTFDKQGDPPLGYVETIGGELFLESPTEIERLTTAFDNLRTLALSPAESVQFIKERTGHGAG
jgi:transcriptional regulator with XRE-family HTH domain